MGGAGGGVLVEKLVELAFNLLIGGPQLLRHQGTRQRQRGRGPAPKTDGGGDLSPLYERNVLDQQAEHPLAFARLSVRVMPDGGEVICKREDALAFFCIEG